MRRQFFCHSYTIFIPSERVTYNVQVWNKIYFGKFKAILQVLLGTPERSSRISAMASLISSKSFFRSLTWRVMISSNRAARRLAGVEGFGGSWPSGWHKLRPELPSSRIISMPMKSRRILSLVCLKRKLHTQIKEPLSKVNRIC